MSSLTINSTFSEVRQASALLQQFCVEHDIPIETQGHLELMLVEAVNNVVEHAYEHQADGKILIELEKTADHAEIKITDQGTAAPGSVMIEGSKLPDANKLPEGGWGLCLIQALADTIEYFRYTDHNILVLTKNTA